MLKKKTTKLAYLMFALGFLVMFLIFMRAGTAEIAAAFGNIVDFKYIFYALLMYCGALTSATIRWAFLLGTDFKRTKFRHLFLLILTGMFINLITPGPRSGGEPARALLLSKLDPKIKKRLALASAVMDGYMMVAVFLVLCIITAMTVFTLWTLTPILYFGTIWGLFFIFFIGGLGTIVLFFRKFGTRFIIGITDWLLPKIYEFKHMKSVRKKYRKYEDMREAANKITRAFFVNVDEMANNPRILFTGIFITYVMYTCIILQLNFVLMAFGIRLPFLIVLSLVILPELLGLISAMPGGFGVLEASMILLFESSLGVTPATATAIMLTSRLINYWLTIFLGFICTSFLWHRILGVSKEELWKKP